MNERVIIDSSIRHGKPGIRGTRVPVHRIIGNLAGGATPEEVCEEYGIIDADVRAALEYAEELVDSQIDEVLRSLDLDPMKEEDLSPLEAV